MYNLPGVKNLLHMDGPTLANIFMGKITTWNDPAIAKLNKGVSLPEHEDHDRAPLGRLGHDVQLHRLPLERQPGLEVGSRHAARASTGRSASGGQGSAGVSALVAQTPGTIGYADVAFALANHFSYFAMKNRSGKFATPGSRGILSAALSDVKPAADNSLSIVNPPKKYANAYPISTYTYVIVALQSSKAADLKKFLFWAVTNGQKGPYTAKLRFVPTPEARARRGREGDREDPLVGI